MGIMVVTGAAGFIGSHLCENLLKEGHWVLGVDNFSTGMKSNAEELLKSPRFSFFEQDACKNWDSLVSKTQSLTKETGEKVGLVFHFASPASPPLYQVLNIETLHVNSVGLEKAIEYANAFGARCIFASTSEVYGDPVVHPQPESYWGYVNSYGERSCYDEAKRYGEALLFSMNKRHQSRHGLVRIFNTYGPRMNPHDGRVVINFLAQALRKEKLTVYGSGEQTRSFCYIDDLVAGILAYAKSDLTEPVNLGNPKEFTVLELAEEVQKMFPDRQLAIEHRTLPQDDPRQRRPDISKATQLLSPWQPRIPLAEGLRKTCDWLQHQNLATLSS